MTILFMGGEISAFIPADSGVKEDATGGRYNSTFSRCSLSAVSAGGYADSITFAGQTSAWVHAYVGVYRYAAGTKYPLILVNGSDADVVRLNWNDATGVTALQYLNAGAVWTTVQSITLDLSTFHDLDLSFTVNSASGNLTLYVAGTERINSGAIDLSHIASIVKVRMREGDFGPRISQVIVADEPTIGWRLLTRYPNAAGATSGFTGAYTDIDETVYSDADFLLSGTANQVSTFAQTGPAITGYTVRAVAVTARAKRGAGGPQNLQLALRSAGTDYFSSSKALSVGYSAYGNIWETNPATAAAWVNTAIDSLQPGVKSIT